MRNPTAEATHGTGKSRSKPLHHMHHDHKGKQPTKKMMIRYRGYQNMMGLYEAVIKHTTPVIKVRMKPLNFNIKKGIQAIVNRPKNDAKLIKSKQRSKINFTGKT